MREAMLDREASVRRARQEASVAEGISWGMGEDAIEEEEVCRACNYMIIYFFVFELHD